MGRKKNGDGIKGILGWHQPNSGNNLIETDILECTKKLYTLIFFIRLKVLSCVSIYGTFYFPKRFCANKICFLEENTVLISGICQIMGTVNHLHFQPLNVCLRFLRQKFESVYISNFCCNGCYKCIENIIFCNFHSPVSWKRSFDYFICKQANVFKCFFPLKKNIMTFFWIFP